MTITPRPKPKQSKADAFEAGAPDARPARKLRGRKAPLALTLPPDLIEAVDAIAVEEDRSRAKMIELLLRRGVEEHAARKRAA
jgi:hypothetical protein